jgi:hypothetical protein
MTRSRRQSFTLLVSGLLTAALLSAGACGGKVDPAGAQANAGCETATDTLLLEGENMLPGRACNNCHKSGGQAAEYPWTVAGTVFGSSSSTCNGGGIAGVKVDILKMDGTTVQFSLLTNSVGNFYSMLPLETPFKARLTQGTKTQMMNGAMATGNCASCHQIPPLTGAPGRISIN